MTDEPRSRILGRVQELRAEILRMSDRAHGRAIKAQILALREEALATADEDLVGILDSFVEEAHATIVTFLGTAAWDDPTGPPDGPPLPSSGHQ